MAKKPKVEVPEEEEEDLEPCEVGPND